MPEYTYRCFNGHKRNIEHSMEWESTFICVECGDKMVRMPSRISGVNWGGLSPSQGEIHPNIRNHIQDAERNK